MTHRLLAVAALLKRDSRPRLLRIGQTTGRKAPTNPYGFARDGAYVASTRQVIRPAGDVLEFNGRPVDLAFRPMGKPSTRKTSSCCWQLTWRTGRCASNSRCRRRPPARCTASPCAADGGAVYVGAAGGVVGSEGKPRRRQAGMGPANRAAGAERRGKGGELSLRHCALDGWHPGIRLPLDEQHARRGRPRRGQARARDPRRHRAVRRRARPDGKRAYVSNWAGRRPRTGKHGRFRRHRDARRRARHRQQRHRRRRRP